MAARRPPMPRSGGSAHEPPRAAGDETAAQRGTGAPEAAQLRPRPRPRPRREDAPASERTPTRPATQKGANPTDSSTRASTGTRAKVIPLGPVKTPEPSKNVQKPAAKAKPGPKPATKPKTKASASQRRIEDRNLLSGAVRKDEKSAQKAQGKGTGGPKKPIPARSFSGRLLALSIALSVFAVLLVPSIGTYSRQRDEISTLRTSIADKQAEQETLKDQIARWDDPLYIKQQARDRINLVMPGERNYMVVGSHPEDEVLGEVSQSPEEVRTDLPWVDALFDSMQRAATD